MTAIILFVIGAILGSFANLLVYRLHNKEKGIVKGRSKCPECKHTLGFWDLIPLLSYTYLRGKCRYCKKTISHLYFIGELLMGSLFALVGDFFPISINTITFNEAFNILSFLLIIFILVIIIVYDTYYREIPDLIMIPAILTALILSFFDPTNILSLGATSWGLKSTASYALLGGLIPLTFFGLQILVSKGRWMGGGDLRLGAFMGIVLGINYVLLAIFLAYILGAIIALLLIITHKKTRNSEIAFGPFLSVGMILAMFWGEQIIGWYLKLLIT